MSTKLQSTSLPFVVAVLLSMGGPIGAEEGAGPAYDEIQPAHLAAHVRFLSHDLMEGRAPASRGGQLAAEYIAAQFTALGLEPAGDKGSFLQQVPIVRSVVDPSFTLTVTGASRPYTLTYVTDIVAFTGRETEQVPVAGSVVFVGHGIVAPEYKWNDYEGVDVKGRIALIMVNDPPAPPADPKLFGGEALTYYGRWTYKFEEAARQGAAGAILIHTAPSATYPWQVVQSSWSGPQFALPNEPGEPVLDLKAWVTEEVARRLVKEGGKDLDALRQAATSRGFRAVPLGVKVSGSIRQQTDRRESPNVIGVLRGTNDKTGVVYTAHYDHLGMREPAAGASAASDLIYNGALDNATGIGGILEIANAFTRAETKPARSIYFVATTAEESGLLGADYFANHPPLPIDHLVVNINVDGLNIIGPAKDIVLLGAERSTLGRLAEDIAQRHSRYVGPDPEPGRGYFFRSDHFPLAKAGVPAVSISESNEYVGKDPAFAKKMRDEYNEKHYHQPSDEFDAAWNLQGAIDDLRFLAELGWRVAEAEQVPTYDASDQFARPRLKR